MNLRSLYIVGTGGLGRGIAELLKSINASDPRWIIEGFIDDNTGTVGRKVNHLSVKGTTDRLLTVEKPSDVVLAIANPAVKERLIRKLKLNPYLSFPNIVHPRVELNEFVAMGQGNIVTEGVVFSANIQIGSFNLIHFNSTIGHDVVMEDYSTIYPGNNISGYVKIESRAVIGTNAAVLPSVRIGKDAIIGAGSVVLKDVEQGATVIGSPAKPINKISNSIRGDNS
ncbi:MULTISPECIES: acetyltransferase [Paenibacillus]|uniref:Acetyltransferase n=1 Tax=Paenibacillus residui TaxID=629724 RepID=A0ABW3D8T7_9BACL|nr:acetyltransferase [Paenibacillus sp. 32O-W]